MNSGQLHVVSFNVTGGTREGGDAFAPPASSRDHTVWVLLSDGSVWSRRGGEDWVDWGCPPPVAP